MSQTRDDAVERLDPAIWRICAVSIFGPMLSQMDATIVNVSLSGMASALDSTLSTIQWVTSGYLLALTLVLPINGWLIHRTGAKPLYLWCLASFTLSSALCGLAWSAGSLIAFRVFQGISGGLLAPMAQMLVARAAGPHMSRVIGIISLPVLLAPIIGPVIAGAILQHLTWRWLFLVNIPVGAVAIALAAAVLPPDRPDGERRNLDWGGLALLSPGMVLFLYGLQGLETRIGLLALAGGLGLIAAFLATARRKGRHALIDIDLFRGPIFGACALSQFLTSGALFSGQMLIPIFLIQACGRTPAEMGWMLAPMGAGMMTTYLAISHLTRKLGPGRLAQWGALLAMLSTMPFIYMAFAGFKLAILIPAMFLRGMGQGAVGLPIMSMAYNAIDKRDLPMATTSLNIVQRLGGPTLTTICATLLSARIALPLPDHSALNTYGCVFAVLAALHGLTAVATNRLKQFGQAGPPTPWK